MPNLKTLLHQIVLRYECLDRLFLNGYVAKLQDAPALDWFLGKHRGQDIPRYELLGEMTRAFVTAITAMAQKRKIPIVEFQRGQRKETIAARYFAKAKREGVVLIGVAQERANVFRPPSRHQRITGTFAATRASAYVKHFYLYILDKDFGRGFIKFCTYAPFSVRVWLNGHEWAMRQLDRRGIAYERLDNGLASVADPRALARLCARLGPAHIQRFFDRWMYILPNPFSRQDRRAGYTYDLSMLQVEVSRTEVFDRPLHGLQFFEEVVHDHLHLGRPEQLSIVLGKRLARRRRDLPARTRVFCSGTEISLQTGHRHTRVKQYLKLGRALRTETTFNDTWDYGIGRRLHNLPALVRVGTDINRRLLALEAQAQHCTPAATDFEQLVLPTGESGRRAPGLRFGDPRVAALFRALADFRWTLGSFRARDLHPYVAQHLGQPYSMDQLAYDLRRLRRKNLIERLPRRHRYVLTPDGRKYVLFCTKVHGRLFCRGLAQLHPQQVPTALNQAWRHFDSQVEAFIAEARLAA